MGGAISRKHCVPRSANSHSLRSPDWSVNRPRQPPWQCPGRTCLCLPVCRLHPALFVSPHQSYVSPIFCVTPAVVCSISSDAGVRSSKRIVNFHAFFSASLCNVSPGLAPGCTSPHHISCCRQGQDCF